MRAVRATLAAVLVLGTGACASTSGTTPPTHGCTKVHTDPFDPGSSIHLLPGAPEPSYVTDPPTSGAHRVGRYPRGVQGEPIPRPIQVALLEVGFVLVQYRPSTGAGPALASLAAANPYVTVAPNPALPDPVVATAWLRDVRCGDASAKAQRQLASFILQRVAHGPAPPIPVDTTTSR